MGRIIPRNIKNMNELNNIIYFVFAKLAIKISIQFIPIPSTKLVEILLPYFLSLHLYFKYNTLLLFLRQVRRCSQPQRGDLHKNYFRSFISPIIKAWMDRKKND